MAAGVGKRMDIRAFYSLKIIKKSFFLLLNGSIMTAYNENMAKKEMLFTVMEFMNQNTPRLVCEQKIA